MMLMLALVVAPLAQAHARALAPPAIELRPLGPGVWWVAGAAGDADAGNRGAISNLLIVADGPRTWALGSGPSLAYGRALARQVQRSTGRRLTDVIAPWSRPELVLGAAALPQARLWAHADVAQAMARRCPGCIQRLAGRLGDAAADLGPRRIPVPRWLLHGDQGRLGPWRWWRVQRTGAVDGGADGATGPPLQVTVWRLDRARLWAAPGLMWADGAPDLRDSHLADMAAATARLRQLAEPCSSDPAGDAQAAPGARQQARQCPDVTRWLPEQGAPASAALLQQHADYWQALASAARDAWERGEAETAAPPALPGVPAHWLASPRHALNWQRAWRDAEAQAFDAAPASPLAPVTEGASPTRRGGSD
jgi:hypothetical protein